MSVKKLKAKFRCCVENCDSYYYRGRSDNDSFFRLPDPERITTPHLQRLARIRLAAWEKFLTKTHVPPPKHWRICRKHFVANEPAKLTDTQSEDWIPTLCLPNGVTTAEALKPISPSEPAEDYSKIANSAASHTEYLEDSAFTIETTDTIVDPLKFDDQLSRFCRLCLRDLPDLLQIRSTIDDIFIPDMLQAVAGISLHDQKDLPEKLCDGCLVNLQTAYGIRQQFVEADSILSEMVQNGDVPLVVSLRRYQRNDKHLTNTDAAQPLSEELTEQLSFHDADDKESQQSKPFVGRTIPEPNDFSNGERGYESRQSDIEKETKLDPNKCYICSEIFDNQEALNIHIPSHVDMIPYSCELCAENNGPRKIMKSLATLHRHFRMHAGTISCPKCPFQLCTVTGLYNHMQRYHSKGSDAGYVCEICGSKMSNRQDLKFHLRSHRALEDGRFTCRFCDKKLTTKSSLVQHERGHTNEKPFKCKYCEKCFNSESHRYTHERMHTGEKGYRCEHCSNCYRTSNALRQHQLTMHANMASVKPRSPQKRLYSQGPVKCNVEGCNFVTNNRATYYSHRNRHAMKHHCEHCSERFAIKESLLQHMYKHTGVKPFSCGLCGKGFLFKNSLNEHLDLHSDVRPYKCEICEMGFVRERTLRKHRLRHTVKKNYQCRFCVMQFKYEGTLTKHERSHAGTVPKSDQEECLEATKTLIVDGINCWVEEDSQ